MCKAATAEHEDRVKTLEEKVKELEGKLNKQGMWFSELRTLDSDWLNGIREVCPKVETL